MNIEKDFLEANALTGNYGKKVNIAIFVAYVLFAIGLAIALLAQNVPAAIGLSISFSILLGAELIAIQLAAIGDANIAITLQKLREKADE